MCRNGHSVPRRGHGFNSLRAGADRDRSRHQGLEVQAFKHGAWTRLVLKVH
jgi:hypothetical protein